MADVTLDGLKEAALSFYSSQVTVLSALWAWLYARALALLKAYGVKTSKSLSFLALLFVPGPWMLTWAWTQPEYNVAKRMVMKLPAVLGSDALPSFVSNPLELQLVLMVAILGVFSVVELVGLVLSRLLCSPSADAGKRGYSLRGLLYLCAAQGLGQFVLFCTDAAQKDFSAKYFSVSTVRVPAAARAQQHRRLAAHSHTDALPPLCRTPALQYLPSTATSTVHLGAVLLCAAAFLRYTLGAQVLGASAPRPSHGTLMVLLYITIMPMLVFGDYIAALVAAFK
jgi:hypothetical protein